MSTQTITTRDGDVTVPAEAVCFPVAGRFPEYQQQAVTTIQRIVGDQNAVRKGNFRDACTEWLAANERDRAMKLPLAPKPIAPPEGIVWTATDVTNAVWVWVTDGVPLGVCPDLPPLPPPAPPMPEPDNIRNVPLGDTMPVGFVVTGLDGAKWQKQSSHTPFGMAYFYVRIA